MYTNADSLLNKRAELEALIEIHKPAVIGIVEVRPKNYRFEVQACEISIQGFETFHNLEYKGRGICLLIKHELMPSSVQVMSKFNECIFVDCKLQGMDNLTIGLVYRSPNSNQENNENLNKLIMEITEAKLPHLLIMGDFNFPEIDWYNMSCKGQQNHPAMKFFDTVNDAYLIQHQKDVTRIREGQTPTVDDLVLTNQDEIVNEVSRGPALGKSDHVTLLINLNCEPRHKKTTPRPNYAKADYNSMRQALNDIRWEYEMSSLSTNESWILFREHLDKVINKFVPVFRGNRVTKKKWLEVGALSSVRKKHKLYRRWLQTQAGEDYLAYAQARNQATRACRVAKRKLETTVAAQAKNNPKSFWSYVQSKTKTKSGVADLLKEDGTKASSDKEKADILNKVFQSVFTVEKGVLPTMPKYEYDRELTEFIITKDIVKKQLKKLKIGKAPGPDGICPRLLVELADVLAQPITIIFQKSLDSGCIPDEWRTATVTPIYKKGSRLLANNYRPVSLTCILCKTMETIVRQHIVDHLHRNNLISRRQHSFIKGRSCATQLLETLDIWTDIIDKGGGIDAIYMDFMKAFDSVPHRRLVGKVEAHGIRGRVLQWTKDFLTNRSQTVIVNGEKSSPAPVTSGIPQGSVLGPVLFLMYINDLPHHVHSNVELFADDTKIFIRSDEIHAMETLQADLNRLQQWSSDWQLRFHPEKCSILKIGNINKNTSYTMSEQDAQGNEHSCILKVCDEEKDLGVWIDSDLKFNKHIAQAAAKARKIMGIIRRSFDYLSPDIFTQLYKSLVRPVLEYGHSVWQPRHKTLCKEVEKVQKRATKLIGCIKNMSYQERLAVLKLPSLEYRRARGDLIDTYKYIHGIYDTDRPDLQLHQGRNTRGHSLKLSKHGCQTNTRANFFSHRVVSAWNSLPEEVVTAPSINCFKNRLDRHWATSTVRYNPTCLENNN
jgi:hypothetical protein